MKFPWKDGYVYDCEQPPGRKWTKDGQPVSDKEVDAAFDASAEQAARALRASGLVPCDECGCWHVPGEHVL